MENPNEHALFEILNAFLEALPDKFKRERKDGVWTPQLVAFALVLMAMDSGGGSYASLLTTLRISRQDLFADAVHASNFCRARKKLCNDVLGKAWDSMRSAVNSLFGDMCPTVHGHQLVAIDGVWINARRSKQLFKELRKNKRGRPPKDPKGQPQILVVVLLDVLTKTPIAWEYVEPGKGERKAAIKISKHLNDRMILLADRGFPSRQLLEILTKQNTHYIIRMTTGATAFAEISDFHASNGRDRITQIKTGKGKRAQNRTARIVRGNAFKNISSMSSHDDWTLLTNLKHKKKWSRQLLLDLYHERWHIEVFFRELKRFLSADKFHSHSLGGIHQEIMFTMVAATLVSVVDVLAHINKRGTVPNRQNSRKNRNNRAQIKTVVFHVLLLDPRAQQVQSILENELRICWKYAQKQRPGRMYPRICKSFYGKWKHKFKKRSA